jgi:citronellol/citronellal dehydrogenase
VGDRLKGRVALITGASRGIGASVARGMAAEGAVVAVTARTLETEADAVLEGSLSETVEAIGSAGGRALPFVADLADPDARAALVPSVVEALGPVDVLVNNAAAAIYQPVTQIPLRRRRLTFELNVHAPIDLAQAVIPAMRQAGRGWIVNISSATSRHPKGPPYGSVGALGATITTYGASKAALERFTTGLAAELCAEGIAVNSLAPVAAVRTPGAEALVGGLMKERPEMVEPVEWIVEAAVALACCDPSSCTGRVVYSKPFLEEIGALPRARGG